MKTSNRSRSASMRQDRGVILPLAALMMTTILVMVAFAVDLGRLRAERRDVQADADAIALDAVQTIGGLNAIDALAAAIAEANMSAARNDFPATLTASEIQVGSWDVAAQSFDAMILTTEFPTAVQVDLSSTIPMNFDVSTDERSVSRTAVAVAQASTRGELGSVLAGVDLDLCDSALVQRFEFMNEIYGELLGIETDVVVEGEAEFGPCDLTGPGSGLQLDALSWRGLGFADVDLNAVAAEMGLGSKDELFDGTVNAAQFLDASGKVLQGSSDVADVDAGNALVAIAGEIDGTTEIALDEIVDVGTGGDSAAEVNALQLLMGSAVLINGENFVSADLPVDLPGIGAINTNLSVIEPPQTHLDYRRAGQAGPRTSQVRASLNIPLESVLVDFGLVTSLLSTLGIQSTTGNLNLVVEVARADSTYTDIQCAGGAGGASATMGVDTGAVTVTFGSAVDFSYDEEIEVDPISQLEGFFGISLPLLGTLGINLGQVTNVETTVNLLGAYREHTFTEFGPDSPWHRYQGGVTGTSTDTETLLGAQSEINYNSPAGSLLSSLGLTILELEQIVDSALQPVISQIGGQVIEPLLSTLGVTLAGADGRILDVRCQSPALANRP